MNDVAIIDSIYILIYKRAASDSWEPVASTANNSGGSGAIPMATTMDASADLFPIGPEDLIAWARWWQAYGQPDDVLTKSGIWGLWQEWACEERGCGEALMAMTPPELDALHKDLCHTLRRMGCRTKRPGYGLTTGISAKERRISGMRPAIRYDIVSLLWRRPANTIKAKAVRATTTALDLAA